MPQVRGFLAAGGLLAAVSPVIFLPFFPPSPPPLNPPPKPPDTRKQVKRNMRTLEVTAKKALCALVLTASCQPGKWMLQGLSVSVCES